MTHAYLIDDDFGAELLKYETGTHEDYDNSLWFCVGSEFGEISEDTVARYLERHGYREV